MTKTTGNATAVRTPGEDAPKGDADLAGATDAAAAGDSDAVGAGDPEPAKPAKKETLEQRMDRLEAENTKLRAALGTPKAAQVDPTADLPDISEFTGKNQHKQAALTGAVLTKQGWLAPAHLGSSPVLHELQKQGLSATGGR